MGVYRKGEGRIYLRLLSYLRPHIRHFAVSLLGYMIFASAQPMLAGTMKYFIDGLDDPAKAVLRGIPLVDGMQLMYGVPILLVAIVAWQGFSVL